MLSTRLASRRAQPSTKDQKIKYKYAMSEEEALMIMKKERPRKSFLQLMKEKLSLERKLTEKANREFVARQRSEQESTYYTFGNGADAQQKGPYQPEKSTYYVYGNPNEPKPEQKVEIRSQFRCLECSKDLRGPCFYCDGDMNYLCWECVQFNSEGHKVCPNCGSDVKPMAL